MSGISMDGEAKGYLFTVLSSLLMSASVVINFVALQSVDVATLTFYFFGFGLFGSVILLAITRKFALAKQLFRKHWKPLAVLGLIGGTVSIFWFFALKLVGSSTMGFLMRFSTVFTVALAVVFLKERINRGEIFAGMIVLLGVFLMMFKGSQHIVEGVILALILSLVISLEQLFMKNYVKKIEPLVFNALRLVFTFLVITIYVVARANFEVPPPHVVLLIFLGAILSAVIGFIFYFKALEISELSKVSIIRSLDPFVIFIYSLIFLGSVPTGLQLAGSVLIGIGAFLLVVARHRPKMIVKLWPNF